MPCHPLLQCRHICAHGSSLWIDVMVLLPLVADALSGRIDGSHWLLPPRLYCTTVLYSTVLYSTPGSIQGPTSN